MASGFFGCPAALGNGSYADNDHAVAMRQADDIADMHRHAAAQGAIAIDPDMALFDQALRQTAAFAQAQVPKQLIDA